MKSATSPTSKTEKSETDTSNLTCCRKSNTLYSPWRKNMSSAKRLSKKVTSWKAHLMYRRVRELAEKNNLMAYSFHDEHNNWIKSTDGIRSRCKERIENKLNPIILPSVLSSFPVIATDPSPHSLLPEIEAAIRYLKTNKDAGPDGIQPELLEVSCRPVLIFIIKSLQLPEKQACFDTLVWSHNNPTR